jgi:flagellar biogenesis protein FliO
MTDVGLGELLLRMVVSLVVVLGLVLGAYAVIRRRQGLPSSRELRGVTRGAAKRTSLVRTKSSGANAKRGLRIAGRVAVGRTSSVVAIQFGDRVFMVGASEQSAPTVLAEMDLDAWTQATDAPEDLTPMQRTASGRVAGGASSSAGGAVAADRRPNFLEALREATTRRG